MLYIYQSSDVLVLKRKLAEVLADRRGLGGLESDGVVVNHFGVAEWLKTSLCEDLNIVANLAFNLPSSSVWELCSLVSGTAAKSFFKADYFKWRILEALPQLTESEGFEFLQRYLVGVGRERKLYQLSASLAYLFEQYLIYRPEWIMHWESDVDGPQRQQASADGAYIQRGVPASVASDKDFCWQGYLWRRYLSPQALLNTDNELRGNESSNNVKDVSENGGKELQVHLVELLYSATKGLTSDVAAVQGIDPTGGATRDQMALLPKRLFLFGLHFLPPEYLRFYQVLSKHCDLYCFLQNPSPEYWGDIVTETYLARKTMEHLQEDRDLELSHYSTTNKLFSFLAQGAKSFFESIVELDTMAIVESLPEAYYEKDEAAALEDGHDTADRSVDNTGLNTGHNLGHNDEAEIRDNSEYRAEGPQRCALPDTLLNTLKHDLRDLVAEHDPTNRVIPVDDWSIQIHNCYNERRELQTLKDSLLHILDNNRGIEPHDIVVMTGDITRYEPFIADVFTDVSDNEVGVRRLPWSVVNSPLAEKSNVIKVFFELLTIPHSDFAPSQMLSLLQIEFIRKRCYLAETDIMRVEELVERLEICWGLDKEGGQSQGLAELPANTWMFGLERILAGFATGASYQPDTDIAPLERVDAELLTVAGGLYVLVERLLKYQAAFSQSYSAQGWRKLLTEVVDDLFALAPVNEVNVIRQVIEEQFAEIADADFTGDLSLVMVQEALRAKSATLLAGGGGHGILFSTMLPLHGIPFKVVCFLGMEDESFPRHDSWQSYDLLVRYPKAGDRNTRGEDLFLFLQSIFAASEFLYISYVGRDMHTDEHYLPSICVRALLDYCDEAYSLASGEKPSSFLLRCHKLLPIASDYFSARDHRLFTYSKSNEFLIRNCNRPSLEPARISAGQPDRQSDWQASQRDFGLPEESYSVARHWIKTSNESNTTMPATKELSSSRVLPISLLELERFFSHPQRYFFRHVQRIRLQNPLSMNDMEPVGIGGAAYRKLFEFLMPMLRDGCDENLCFKIASRRGLLPWGGRGEDYFARRCNVMREMLAIGSPGELRSVPCELELKLGESISAASDRVASERPRMVCLRGNIDVIVRDAATGSAGGNSGVNGVELFTSAPFPLEPPQLHHWLRHLVLCAVGSQNDMSGLQLVRSVECGVTIREGSEKIESQMYNMLPATEAVHHLQDLIALFMAGLEAPLPLIRQLSYQVFQKKADLGYLWDDFRLGSDRVARPSPYLHLAFPLDSPSPEDAGFCRDEFERIALSVYAPISRSISQAISRASSDSSSHSCSKSGSDLC